MAKLVSISGVIYRVRDIKKTAEFYKNLGFLITNQDDDMVSIRLNWFWVDFIKADDHYSTGNDNEYLYISVDNVDEIYGELKEKNLKPTEPETFKTGRRETMLSDPDGYKLVFFQKK